MNTKPSVLTFEEFPAQTVKRITAQEYHPDRNTLKSAQLEARQKVSVKGISNDGRLVVRVDSRPFLLLVEPNSVKTSAGDVAEAKIRHNATLMNQNAERYFPRFS